jgi:hypothetical protein
MRITSRGFTAVTVGLVSAVLLAGCSGDSTKPTVLPTLPSSSAAPTTTASPTAAVTTSVPAPPSAASVTTKPSLAATNKEIEKAVRAYYTTVDLAIDNPAALKRMQNMYGPGCSQCASDAKNISNLMTKHWVVTGGRYQIVAVKGNATSSRAGSATVSFRVPPATIRDGHGKIVATENGHPNRAEGLTLALVGGSWKILGDVSFGTTK